MSDEDTQLEQAAGNPVEQAVAEYNPVEHLSTEQVHAVMKIVIFPKISNKALAESLGKSERTISNWKQNTHFKALLNAKTSNLLNESIEASARRRALLYDKLSEEVFKRFEAPKTDKSELERILGPDYTEQDRQKYRDGHIVNMAAKELLKIWQADERMVEEKESTDNGLKQEQLVVLIRERHVELRAIQTDITAFVRRTGFDFNVNYHDEDPERAFNRREEMGIIDVDVVEESEEIVEEKENTESVMEQYSLM